MSQGEPYRCFKVSHRSRAETDGYKNPPQNIPTAAIKCKLSLMIEDIVAKKMV